MSANQDDWLTADEAAGFLGVTVSLVYLWAQKGCPLLGGAKLSRRTFMKEMANGRPRSERRFSLKQLEHVRDLRSASQQIAAADTNWISWRQTKDQFGFEQEDLYRWHRKGCPFLAGEKLGAARVAVGVGGGRVRKVWHFNRLQVEEIARRARKEPLARIVQDEEGTWLPAALASERFGITIQHLERWREKSCSFLGGSVIRHKQVPCVALGERHGGALWVYHEDDLRQIRAARRKPASAVYTDAEGTWLFASEVAHRFGLRADNLWHFRAKAYAFLPEGKIRAKQVNAASPQARKARCRLWVYHEDDVKRVAAHRAGEPVPPAAPTPTQTLPPPSHPVTAPTGVPEHVSHRRGRGRPKGKTDDWLRREREMLEAWDRGEYESKAQAARANGFHRPDATVIINAHEEKKRRNNSSA